MTPCSLSLAKEYKDLFELWKAQGRTLLESAEPSVGKRRLELHTAPSPSPPPRPYRPLRVYADSHNGYSLLVYV
jgi:hypothetical protein